MTRRVLSRALIASAAVIATAVLGLAGTLLVGRLFGPGSFRTATDTGALDVALAAMIAIFARRWSRIRRRVTSGRTPPRAPRAPRRGGIGAHRGQPQRPRAAFSRHTDRQLHPQSRRPALSGRAAD